MLQARVIIVIGANKKLKSTYKTNLSAGAYQSAGVANEIF